MGYPVFPCYPGAKNPLTENGLLAATTDEKQITEWWTKWPTANIAIRTDGFVVIDIDIDDSSWLGDLDDRWTDLGKAPSARTPRGGRHLWFRQPTGKKYRNTQKRLAMTVDTRAMGGYVLVPPSKIDDVEYGWISGFELDVTPDRLPLPPDWLVSQLDRITSLPAVPDFRGDGRRIVQGERDGTLTSYAGTMRRVGLTQKEIASALHQVNADRCEPPLDLCDVEKIARSVSRYVPSEEPKNQDDNISIISLDEGTTLYPTIRPPIIHGLLRRGETMNVIAAAKTGKSWMVNGMAISMVLGEAWLGMFDTVGGKVLVIDNELHPETIVSRFNYIRHRRGANDPRIGERVHFASLRGKLADIHAIRRRLDRIPPGEFSLVIVDALYKTLPQGTDENSNVDMAGLYSTIDAFADRQQCCSVLIHHASKGNQSGKSVTDVGSGAGSQSRSADTHLVMRPHEEPLVVVLEAAVRSWEPIAPRCLRWEFPFWVPAPECDPALLHTGQPKQRTSKQDEPDVPAAAPAIAWTLDEFIRQFIIDVPKSMESLEIASMDAGLGRRQVRVFIEDGCESGKIFVHRTGDGGKRKYSLPNRNVIGNDNDT